MEQERKRGFGFASVSHRYRVGVLAVRGGSGGGVNAPRTLDLSTGDFDGLTVHAAGSRTA